MKRIRKTFATRVDCDAPAAIRKIAKEDGGHPQSSIGEALGVQVDRRGEARPHVIFAYRMSLERFGPL